jgi:hypothetical protein
MNVDFYIGRWPMGGSIIERMKSHNDEKDVIYHQVTGEVLK